MGFLSKLILNGVEMLIKDSTARELIATNSSYIEWCKRFVSYIPINGALYVNGARGNDENDGLSRETALKTIGRAVELGMALYASPRNTIPIVVAGGTYNENIHVGREDMFTAYEFVIEGDIIINGSVLIRYGECRFYYPNEVTTISINSLNSPLTDGALMVCQSAKVFSTCRLVLNCINVGTGLIIVDGSDFESLGEHSLTINGNGEYAVWASSSNVRSVFDGTFTASSKYFRLTDSILFSVSDHEPTKSCLNLNSIVKGDYIDDSI